MPPGVHFTGWQLSFAGLTSNRIAAQTVLPDTEPPARGRGAVRGQLALFECERDFTRFSAAHQADPGNPTLIAARRVAQRRGEAYGWSHWLATEVDRGLVILLSQHIEGDRVRYSQITPLDRVSVNVSRTAGVLAELDLLIDDRPDTLDAWAERKLAQLAPGIAADVRGWTTALRTGEQRTQRHSEQTVRHYLKQAHPHLVEADQSAEKDAVAAVAVAEPAAWHQEPYFAQPASSERLTVGRDGPHSTGMESTIQVASVHDVSVTAIAKPLGVSPGTLYSHVPTCASCAPAATIASVA